MSETSRIKNLIRKIKTDGKTRLISIIACIVALLLIIGANAISRSDKSETVSDPVSEYVYSLERKLESLLSKVDGAGKVSVAISVESGMETVLAMTTTTKETSAGREIISTPVMVNGKTVVLKEKYPEITGVLIIAEGAGSISVYTKVQQAAVSLLNVKVGQIEILTMK